MDKSGIGPEAVAADAVTYAALQAEAEKRALLERSMGRWAGEAKRPLRPGEVPRQTTGPWATGDHLGVEPPAGLDINRTGG